MQVENCAINEKDLVFLSTPDSADKRKVHAFLTISGMREKRTDNEGDK